MQHQTLHQFRFFSCLSWIGFCLLFLLLNATGISQSHEVQFRLYSFDEGLTHRNIIKVQQDTFGYLWFATINGLNKYDGHQFTHYTSRSEALKLPSDFLTDLLIDENNQIWLGCGTDLLAFNLEEQGVQALPLSENNTFFEQERRFYNVFKDSDGGLWTLAWQAQTGKTVVQKVNEQGALEDIQTLAGDYSNRPLAEVAGHIFCGSLDNEVLQFSDAKTPPSTIKIGEEPVKVIQFQVTASQTLYALLNNGEIWYLENGQKTFQKHRFSDLLPRTTKLTAFLVEPNGSIWIGGESKLWFFDVTTNLATDFNEQLREVFDHKATFRQIFKDRTGVLWIATDFGVVSVHRFEKLFTTYLSKGDQNCNNGTCSTRGITEDEAGNIYVSYYHSIHRIDPNTNEFRPLFRRNRYFSLPFAILYHQNALWTGEGLRIDLQTLQVDTLIQNKFGSEGVNMLDREGNIWFGCARSLCYYNPNTKKLNPYQDPKGLLDPEDFQLISFLHEGHSGEYIWVATRENGVYKISKRDGGLAHYNTETSSTALLSSRQVLVVQEDGNNNLWLGTANGLNKIDLETNKIKIFTTKEGLPNNFINGILMEGDSVLWLSTDRGLSRMDINTEAFYNFFEADGLSRNEFNRISFYRSRNGRMYFGGLNGLNAFYPSAQFTRQTKEEIEGKMLLTGFSKFDGLLDSLVVLHESWENNKPIWMSWRDHFFNFSFALTDYANPRAHLYRYQLEGFDEGWSTPSNYNFAKYNNVPAGQYIFRVQGATESGGWVKDELTIPVSIQQAFFRRKWFLVLCGLLAAGLIYGIAAFRAYQAARRSRELEQLVKERTKELEQEKQKSEELLLNILPLDMANELKENGSAKARRHEAVTVLFSDFKNFVKIAEKMEPEELVREVDYCFRTFDEIMEMYGLEKIKTIGDAYMCVGGIRIQNKDAVIRVVKAALEIQAFMKAVAFERIESGQPFFEARIGIHTGPVVAGIVGIKKFAYDIWGDTVNIAARMEENSEPGKVNISASTYELVKKHFECTHRGKILAKNKGEVDMYFVERVL